MVTADHGPAVSGAHNTIVCARAGKDLVSSLVSGLLTVVSISYLNGSIIYIGFHFMEESFICFENYAVTSSRKLCVS
jgi:hypothetical protein